ncbi:MAG: cyclodeaminase/cyclohydrolase family protein [Elusimicrobiaceae bacterium]|nr:cyclodeaminase/cyclohydrolase family protein [Elusimicrobiaceae bacterium]
MQWSTAAEYFIAALASSDPTPGGGAAAAQTGAMGCALVMMAIGTTLKRKNLPTEVTSRLDKSLKRLGSLKTELSAYVKKDAEAYANYLTARKLPKEDSNRPDAIQQALFFAASVPADTATTALQVLKETENIKDDIADVILSDIYCAKHLLQACIHCAIENIQANLSFITNEDKKNIFEKQISVFLKSC